MLAWAKRASAHAGKGAEAAGQLPAQQGDFALGYSLLKSLLLPLFGPFDDAFCEHGVDLL